MIKRPPKTSDVPEGRRPRYRLRRVLVGMGLGTLFPVLLIIVSLAGAMRTPGNEGLQAKWADWMRNHHASWLVNRVEHSYYAHQAPRSADSRVA